MAGLNITKRFSCLCFLLTSPTRKKGPHCILGTLHWCNKDIREVGSEEKSAYIENIHALTKAVVQRVELGGQVLCYLCRKIKEQ